VIPRACVPSSSRYPFARNELLWELNSNVHCLGDSDNCSDFAASTQEGHATSVGQQLGRSSRQSLGECHAANTKDAAEWPIATRREGVGWLNSTCQAASMNHGCHGPTSAVRFGRGRQGSPTSISTGSGQSCSAKESEYICSAGRALSSLPHPKLVYRECTARQRARSCVLRRAWTPFSS